MVNDEKHRDILKKFFDETDVLTDMILHDVEEKEHKMGADGVLKTQSVNRETMAILGEMDNATKLIQVDEDNIDLELPTAPKSKAESHTPPPRAVTSRMGVGNPLLAKVKAKAKMG